MVCGLRDHSPLYVNLYVLGYEYCPCHYPPLHFYYCQIDKIDLFLYNMYIEPI